jgi:hypothetical protein
VAAISCFKINNKSNPSGKDKKLVSKLTVDLSLSKGIHPYFNLSLRICLLRRYLAFVIYGID